MNIAGFTKTDEVLANTAGQRSSPIPMFSQRRTASSRNDNDDDDDDAVGGGQDDDDDNDGGDHDDNDHDQLSVLLTDPHHTF